MQLRTPNLQYSWDLLAAEKSGFEQSRIEEAQGQPHLVERSHISHLYYVELNSLTMSDETSASLSVVRDLKEEIGAAGDHIGRLVQPAFNLMMEELKSLEYRKAALATYLNKIVSDSESEHKLNDVNSSILKLNVGGKDINVRKGSILSRTSPDSLFGILASGRWDNHLTKDQNGRIFLDIDPE
jgi:hypothetical protein